MQPGLNSTNGSGTVNAADVDTLVKCYEPDAVFMAEDPRAGSGAGRDPYRLQAIVSFGGALAEPVTPWNAVSWR